MSTRANEFTSDHYQEHLDQKQFIKVHIPNWSHQKLHPELPRLVFTVQIVGPLRSSLQENMALLFRRDFQDNINKKNHIR